MGEGQSAEEADGEGPGDVDADGAPGQAAAHGQGQERDPVARDAAERAAEGDPERHRHGRCLAVDLSGRAGPRQARRGDKAAG